MRSRLFALVLALALSGVAGGCSSVTGALVPSPACGGVHLLVINKAASPVIVRINGTDFATVAGPGNTQLIQHFTSGLEAKGWPWKVEIVEAGTGQVLATREVAEDVANGSAIIEVTGGSTGAPTVSEVQPGNGC
jgi:hypothetical protein